MSFIPPGTAGGPVLLGPDGTINTAHIKQAQSEMPSNMSADELYEILTGIAKLLGCDVDTLRTIGKREAT